MVEEKHWLLEVAISKVPAEIIRTLAITCLQPKMELENMVHGKGPLSTNHPLKYSMFMKYSYFRKPSCG